jgi:phosphodiesterase/alkaline phosphatase D-like protein
VNLAGLTAGTTYHYRVKSRDAAGNLRTSGDFTFTTDPPADTTAPTISSVASSNITTNSARITWTTNEGSDTQVEYGTTTSYGSSSTLNTSMVTSHTVNLAGLAAGTLYHYRVKSRDAAGNLRTSGDFTFTTDPAADTTPPTISSVSVSSITTTGATISWTTNEASNTQVEYGTTTSYGSWTTVNPAMVTSHSANLTGLSANTLYHYRVKSRDAAGNLQTSGDFTFTTNAPPDTTAPTISGVASSSVTVSGATIAWTTNEASDTQVEYGTTTSYGSSTTLNPAMVTSHSANLTGLAAGTLYHYRVKSRDAAGNLRTSGDFTFTTQAGPDTTPPIISSIASSNITSGGATITWTTNEAANTQVEYGTTTSYGSSTTLDPALVTSHAVNLSGLADNTTYHYRVLSRDAAGNLRVSSDGTFTTAAAAPPALLRMLDDGSPGHTKVGTWTHIKNKGYANDYRKASKGSGSTSSTWSFNGLPAGEYQVWVTWRISSTHATNSPFSIYDGGVLRKTTRLNQRLTPSDLSANGALWKQLGTVTVNSGRIVVRLSNAANGSVVADAVRVEQVRAFAPAPLHAAAPPPPVAQPAPRPVSAGPTANDLALLLTTPDGLTPNQRRLNEIIGFLATTNAAL